MQIFSLPILSEHLLTFEIFESFVHEQMFIDETHGIMVYIFFFIKLAALTHHV